MILAVKCAPQKSPLSNAHEAGIEAVELYMTQETLVDMDRTIEICRNYPLMYAIHAPTDGSSSSLLADFALKINAKAVILHNVYWENEWPRIIDTFSGTTIPLCIENTYSIHEPVKFIKRYGMKGCLDLEHLQMETCGIYEEIFLQVIKMASHIHLTGYTYGSNLWHTHIHHSPEHGKYMLSLINKSGYSGFVVSEAKVSLQTSEEFSELKKFYDQWKKENEGD